MPTSMIKTSRSSDAPAPKITAAVAAPANVVVAPPGSCELAPDWSDAEEKEKEKE